MFKSNEVLTMEREILLLLNYNLELTTEEIWQVARPFMTAPYMKVSKSEAMSVDLCFHLLALQKTQFGSHSGHSTSPTQPPAAISVLHQATDSPLVVTPDSIHPFSSLQPLTAHPSQTHPAASSLLVSDSICVSPTKLGNPITQSASTVGYQPLPRSSKMLSTVRRSSDVRDLEKPQNPPVSTRPGTHRLSPSPRLRKRQCVEPNKLRKASYSTLAGSYQP